ncbi:choline dehydrogenase-like flavoprotein [Sphingomonas zeicaulis]|uniref:FAD-dependent oxidoreductase n=1 Tax=Sphingomonas zeicaulis TaxID=1632740 RepID=UPI003D1E87A9
MHIDLLSDAPDSVAADVAVIGGGAAGITMARRLLAGGRSVVLLESGGLDWEAAIADLNDGESVGRDYYDLRDARLRFFGGTTAIWGGRCAEFDPIDFARRSWVPHSGWPFAVETLRPYYAEARAALGLRPQVPDAAELGGVLARLSRAELATPLWSFDDQFDRFSFARCRDLVDHPRCTVVTHATVREIVAAPSGRGIERLDVVALSGRRLQVRAGHHVLAAGGIESPRLMLASRSVMSRGLGNGHDLVGRFFMEHPHARGGRIVDGAAWQLLAAFQKRELNGEKLAALLAPSAALQAREGLLNTSLTIAGRRPEEAQEALLMRAYLHAKHRTAPTRQGRSLWKLTKRVVNQAQALSDPFRPWLLNRLGRLDVALVVRAEQAPNPASRVMLADDVDAAGVPRVKLDWRTSPIDKHSIAGLVAALGRETERLGLGRVEPAPWLGDSARDWATDPLISSHPIGGYHHMGTLRMADSPRAGVTDAFGRVHGIDNLHVAGSALFPTSGWANPTLTIIALAMRTADSILGQFGRSLPSDQDALDLPRQAGAGSGQWMR